MDKPLTVTAPTIHTSYFAFAKALKELAIRYDIDRFSMSFRPPILDKRKDMRVRDEMRINYSATDGRGRPDSCISITYDATFVMDIDTDG